MEIIINTENQILYKSLLSLLKTMGIKVKTEPKEITSNKKNYPLQGTLLKYEKPFEEVSDLNDWNVLK
jgi:hypothetical protein